MKNRIPWGIFILLFLWSVLSFSQFVHPLFLPNPLHVIREFGDLLVSGVLFRHIYFTIYRLIIGFTIGTLIGIPIGLIMGYSSRIYNALEAIIEVFRAIPVIALFPLFLIIFGIGDKSKFMIAAWSSSLIILINTMYGVQHSSRTRKMVARSLGATKSQIFRKVVLPDALPQIIVGLRTSVSIAIIVVLMSEMFLGTHDGLGQLIYNTHLMYDIPGMYVGIVTAGIIGYTINLVLIAVQKKVVHWTSV